MRSCSSLIREAKGDNAFEYIRQALGRFAGRDLAVDEAVFASESATGDRNRAIAYLLRTSHVIKQDVGAVLETYFRQCAVLVTARDIAVMAATIDRDAKVRGMLVAEGGASGPRVAVDAANGLLFGFSTSDPVRVAGITVKPPGKTPIAVVVRVPLPLPAP